MDGILFAIPFGVLTYYILALYIKKKIAILGSTGSIGKNLLSIIKNKPQNYEITLLSANKNYKELLSQANFLKLKTLLSVTKKYMKK